MTYSEYRGDWHRSLIDDDMLDSEQIFTFSSPRYKSLSRTVIELIVNICEELNFSGAIEFTCLDTFDSYVASFYEQTIRRYENILSISANPPLASLVSSSSLKTDGECSGNGKQKADDWMVQEVEEFESTLMIRLVAVLMLSAKLIGNKTIKPAKLTVFVGLLSLISIQSISDAKQLKATEFEVFQTLKFSIKPSASFHALELFVSLASNLPESLKLNSQQTAQLEFSSMHLLRVSYIARSQIHQQYRDKFGQLDWEATMASLGSRQTIWFPAAVVICASRLGCGNCNDWQRFALEEAVMIEAGLAWRSVRQLVVCLLEMFDDEYIYVED